MGKESRQHLVLVVIVLAAVVLIDLGNSKLSGKSIENTIELTEKIPDGETEESNSLLAYSTTTTGGSSEQSLRMQPPIAEPFCEEIELTQTISEKTSTSGYVNDILDWLAVKGDERYQLLTIVNRNTLQKEWVIYDLGSNNRIGDNDDSAIKGNNLGMESFIGMTSKIVNGDMVGKTKLFWREISQTVGEIVIKSCTIEIGCTDRKEEARFNLAAKSTADILAILPVLFKDELYIYYKPSNSKDAVIESCSLDATKNNACKNGVGSLTRKGDIPTFGQYSTTYLVKDKGILTETGYFFNAVSDIAIGLPRYTDGSSAVFYDGFPPKKAAALDRTNNGISIYDVSGARGWQLINTIEPLPKDYIGYSMISYRNNQFSRVYFDNPVYPFGQMLLRYAGKNPTRLESSYIISQWKENPIRIFPSGQIIYIYPSGLIGYRIYTFPCDA